MIRHFSSQIMNILVFKNLNLILLLLLVPALVIHSYDLTILHNNDFHTHYEPINVWGSECKVNQTCFGGIARTVTKVNDLVNKRSAESVLFLNGGDHFQGTIWYTFQKWKVVAKFVKEMNHDVMALGNHEFDDGIEGLIPFIRNVSQNYDKNLTIVCSNIETSSDLKELVRPSIVLERKGRKIAIIGYITPETSFLARPGPQVKFLDEIESIKKEIQSLKQSDPTINIFIALGHSGFEKDKEIAEKIPELDVVVGGHSNTFLYTGKAPSIEVPEGDYPVVFDHGKSGQTLVVQAYAYGKYLGVLDIKFDDKGIITSYSGEPILLDESVAEDPKTLEQVKEMAAEIEDKYKLTIGTSYVQLNQIECRQKECNAGNMFADSFVQYFTDLNREDLRDRWTSVAISLLNGGSVRTGMSAGNITMKDVISGAPFGSQVGVLKVKGSGLWDILQHSTSQYKLGGFLQVSGIKYQFNSKKPLRQRLEWVRVRCADCLYPVFEDLNLTKTYSIAITDYLVNGGDNYTMIKVEDFDSSAQIKDFDVIQNYVSNYSPLMTAIEDRIIDSADSGAISLSNNYNNYSIILFFIYLYQLFKSNEESI